MPTRAILTVIILLLGFGLRVADLTDVPPGLTHDEANHGREAMDVLDGVYRFFFPLNYGSEPLYSYTVAGSMLLLGRGLLALRLVNVMAGVATISLTGLWAKHAFDRRTAILTMALMSVSFWPVASSREALRAGMLPFFTAAAAWFFWQIAMPDEQRRPGRRDDVGRMATAFGISIAITLHIYLAARVAWLVFPLFLLYLWARHRNTWRRTWLPTTLGLVLAGLLVVPMFVYLESHPEALTRLDMLDRPLQQLRSGDWSALLSNIAEALLAFVWPGKGDTFLAYNIPGRPVFGAVSAFFFASGIAFSVRRWRQPAYAFLLAWFFVGIVPSLITGATANTTRNLAAMPAAHLLPAVGLIAISDAIAARSRSLKRFFLPAAGTAWIMLVGWSTIRDYFLNWAQLPEVRGAYQQTLIEALNYLEQLSPASPIVLSTVYPGPAHDPSIGQVMLPSDGVDTRWVDMRQALLLPGGRDALAIIPSSTPPHEALASFLNRLDVIELRPEDLDPSFSLYLIEAGQLRRRDLDMNASFDGAATLLHAGWINPTVTRGGTAEMVSIWRVEDPARVGPIVPPAYTTDVNLFTQVLDDAGGILAQQDALDAPSWDWEVGDIIVQIHSMRVPEQTEPGEYATIIGMYDRSTLERRQVVGADGESLGDHVAVMALQVRNP